MVYVLNEAIELYDKDAGDMKEVREVKVVYRGRDGLKSLKSLQDNIFKAFQRVSSGAESKDSEVPQSAITSKDILNMLEMTGSSESIFTALLTSLEKAGMVDTVPFSAKLQDQVSVEDLDGICVAVLECFLLPKVIQRMTSMSN